MNFKELLSDWRIIAAVVIGAVVLVSTIFGGGGNTITTNTGDANGVTTQGDFNFTKEETK